MFYDRYLSSDDGLSLHLRDYYIESEQLPVICLPGLSRNVKDFHKLALFLSQRHETRHQTRHRVICIDYRGRGESDWDPNKKNYNIIREAQDVLLVMDKLGIEKANFIGTSRGGLIIHILATLKLDALASIVFNDIGPEIELNGLLDIQNHLENTHLPEDWQDAARLQKERHGSDFTTLTSDDWDDMARDIYVENNGRIKADFDPSIIDSIKILDKNTRLPTLWEQFALLKNNPLLTIRGNNSTLFSHQVLTKMSRIHPDHKTISVKDQGHPPILHKAGLEKQIAMFFLSGL